MVTRTAFQTFSSGILKWPIDFSQQSPVVGSFDIFFVVSMNKLLNKWASYYTKYKKMGPFY